MKNHPLIEKWKLPYSPLLQRETGRAAAYTNEHKLVVPLASQELVAYALDNASKVMQFDAKLHAKGLPNWRPPPEWATADVQSRLEIVWLRRPTGEAPNAEWLAIPQC